MKNEFYKVISPNGTVHMTNIVGMFRVRNVICRCIGIKYNDLDWKPTNKTVTCGTCIRKMEKFYIQGEEK